jgi:HAD superfamily hydrolase (TIGR01509 family)
MSLKAIIWDVDGTLVDSEELHRAAFNWAFEHVGLDWHWSRRTYGDLLNVTGGKERIRHFIDFSNINEESLPATPEEIHAMKTEWYSQIVRKGELALRNGVGAIIEEAFEKEIRLAIATTTSPSNVEDLFVSGVLKREHWETVVAGGQVAHKKPAPDVYLEVLRRLDLKSTDCIAVEDSENGMDSAATAKIPTIITTNEYTHHQNFGKEIALVHCLKHGYPTLEGKMAQITISHFEAWHAAAKTLGHAD